MSHRVQGAIAAGNPKTAEAGAEMLRLGGNAFDAAVAAVLAACVAEPCLTSLAGGGFLLAHTPSHSPCLFDFFAQTPRLKRPHAEVDFYPIEVDFGVVTQEFHVGMGSIAVPGVLAGLWHVHQKLGRLPFSAVVEPAIHFAQTGIEVDPFQAYCFRILMPIWSVADEARRVAAPNGLSPQPGEIYTMPELANTLSEIAKKGVVEFYRGEFAAQLVHDCQQQGGYLTWDDLNSYQVIERSPLTIDYRGNTFLTNPAPSSGGTLIAFTLSLLSQVELGALPFGSAEHLSLLAQAMQLTNLARKDGYDARLYEAGVVAKFLAPDHLAPYVQELVQPVNKWGSTTHISVIDSEGNAASVTTSNGEGSSYVIPGTGVMVNNMLGESDLHPGGFHQWQENQRISSMMAPTIVLKQGQPALVLGSGGSNRIRTAILQVISNVIDFQMPIEQAVSSPRVHWENGVFNIEPGLDNLAIDRTQFPFNQELVLWEQSNMFFGGVHTVAQSQHGGITAVGDRRRSGAIAFG